MSRSGHTRRPHTSASSPVLMTAASSDWPATWASPSSSLAPPVPPERARITGGGRAGRRSRRRRRFYQAPLGAAPGEDQPQAQADGGETGEQARSRALSEEGPGAQDPEGRDEQEPGRDAGRRGPGEGQVEEGQGQRGAEDREAHHQGRLARPARRR